jgi:hypothetical protein
MVGGTWDLPGELRNVSWSRPVLMRKARPRLKETNEYFMSGSLPVQQKVIMGYGLVDHCSDSDWSSAMRGRQMVGLDGHWW